MSIISKFLTENRKRCIWIYCIGDSIVDEYFTCKVNRISPEFPMPIVLVEERESTYRPGGVANVAYQLKHFNSHTELLTIYDGLAQDVFLKHKLDIAESVGTIDSKIPVKQRFLDNGIQVIRIDFEGKDFYLPKDVLEKAVRHLVDVTQRPAKPDVAIFSDYNKGLLYDPQLFIKPLKETITIVDPKKGPLKKWKGCTVFKPNAIEAKELSGLDSWREQCDFFKKELECKSVIITQGGNGVVGLEDEYFEYFPKNKVNVESVIGAGDCFIALLSLALGHKFKLAEAAEIAFEAGRIYVQNKMNRPIVPAELAVNQIVHPKDLASRDFKLVFTNGCFDFGLTAAHVSYLEEAKQLGDKLVVAINSDSSIRRIKGPGRPIMNLEDRIKIVSGLRSIDFIVTFEEDTPFNILQSIKPDLIVKGGDYQLNDIVGHEIAPVCIVPKYNTQSTSEKLEKIRKNCNRIDI